MYVVDEELEIIKRLVGDSITADNLSLVECFTSSLVSMFMPLGGHCGYAVSPKHNHPSYMFVLAYDNETTVYINDKKIETSPNTLFCLSPEIQHQEIQNYIPPKYCAIFIDKDFFEKNLKIYTEQMILFDGLVLDVKTPKLDSLIKDFIAESLNQHLSKETLLLNLSTLVTHEIIRTVVDYETNIVSDSDNIIINETIKFMNIHYDKEISVDDLATVAQLSKSHFSKLFSQSMKISPMEYLKTLRLQNGKKMLLSKQLSVTQISQQCGFNSPSYFTKLFKDMFDETPKEFMRRI